MHDEAENSHLFLRLTIDKKRKDAEHSAARNAAAANSHL